MNLLAYRDLFTSMTGLIVAVVATLSSVLTAIFGPFKKMRLPVESVPGTSRGVLNLVMFAPFLICFFSVSSGNARIFLYCSLIPLVLAVWSYQRYGSLLGLHGFTKPRPRKFLWWTWIREDTVIGGTVLQPDAQALKKKGHQNEQELLAGAEYKPDEIWPRKAGSPFS